MTVFTGDDDGLRTDRPACLRRDRWRGCDEELAGGMGEHGRRSPGTPTTCAATMTNECEIEFGCADSLGGLPRRCKETELTTQHLDR